MRFLAFHWRTTEPGMVYSRNLGICSMRAWTYELDLCSRALTSTYAVSYRSHSITSVPFHQKDKAALAALPPEPRANSVKSPHPVGAQGKTSEPSVEAVNLRDYSAELEYKKVLSST